VVQAALFPSFWTFPKEMTTCLFSYILRCFTPAAPKITLLRSPIVFWEHNLPPATIHNHPLAQRPHTSLTLKWSPFTSRIAEAEVSTAPLPVRPGSFLSAIGVSCWTVVHRVGCKRVAWPRCSEHVPASGLLRLFPRLLPHGRIVRRIFAPPRTFLYSQPFLLHAISIYL